MVVAKAVGKQMFLEFDNNCGCGCTSACMARGTSPATSPRRDGCIRGRPDGADKPARDSGGFARRGFTAHEHWGPRVARLRMSEQETAAPGADSFPPDPIGAVRVRLLTDNTVADLRGPTACDVLTPEEVKAIIAKLGTGSARRLHEGRRGAIRRCGPQDGDTHRAAAHGPGGRQRHRQRLSSRAPVPCATRPAQAGQGCCRRHRACALAGLDEAAEDRRENRPDDDHGWPGQKKYAAALANREDRHWVYHRTGEPCRVCGTPIVMEVCCRQEAVLLPGQTRPDGAVQNRLRGANQPRSAKVTHRTSSSRMRMK